MSISVVVVTYRRLQSLERILTAWLKETNDVWLADGSGEGYKTSLPVKIIHAKPDCGNKLRHAVAMMCGGDLVIKADDDFLPMQGLATDFETHAKTYPDAILGIHGRVFHGDEYYHKTKYYGAKSIEKPMKVNFVGVCTCTPRKYLAMDLRGCESCYEDLFWQMKCYPAAGKVIIKTDKFMHLQESKDKGRLCGTPSQRDIRNKFYNEWYNKNYVGKK